MTTIKEMIEKLETDRAKILYTICENENIWEPNTLIALVHRARTITKTLKVLKGADEGNPEYSP